MNGGAVGNPWGAAAGEARSFATRESLDGLSKPISRPSVVVVCQRALGTNAPCSGAAVESWFENLLPDRQTRFASAFQRRFSGRQLQRFRSLLTAVGAIAPGGASCCPPR